MPASAKAWSVGAKRVNGPAPWRVSSNSACTTAETSESWMPVHCAVRGMSFGLSVGVRTLSITWITPLLVFTSAMDTVASFTITPPSTVNASGWPLTAFADMQSVTAEAGTSPLTTWYSRISVSAAFPSGVSRAARSMPASANAWSVGAKTVNGPVPCRVSNSSAWITPATSES